MLSSYGKYNIYLPLVSHLWIAIGFKPIITIVYNEMDKMTYYIYNILKKQGVIINLKYIQNYSNLNYFSRIERIFNFYKVNDENGIYLTSDADMIPVKKEFFTNINIEMFNIKSYGIEGYGDGVANKRWPMCYFISKKRGWKRVLNINSTITKKNIDEYIKNLMSLFLKRSIMYYAGSYHRVDEIYMRDRIRLSKMFPQSISFYKRNFDKTRVYKEDWDKLPHKVNWSNIYDIHLPSHIKNITHAWSKIIKLVKYFNINEYDMNYIKKIKSLI